MPSGNTKHKIPAELRKRVFIRSNFTCECFECGTTPQDTRDLVVHHIDGDRQNHDLFNLCTMRRDCHMAYHNRLRAAKRKFSAFIKELDKKYPPTSEQLFPFADVED